MGVGGEGSFYIRTAKDGTISFLFLLNCTSMAKNYTASGRDRLWPWASVTASLKHNLRRLGLHVLAPYLGLQAGECLGKGGGVRPAPWSKHATRSEYKCSPFPIAMHRRSLPKGVGRTLSSSTFYKNNRKY
uniref:Uncharacterized protein n=1 Tax=Morchella importuna TaxID=1174673 RepID=A0A650AFA8_9PEZI|nr:hypothetical protein [Morchella importuna]QGN66723.1 hypothetical protein [Morchella importuna]